MNTSIRSYLARTVVFAFTLALFSASPLMAHNSPQKDSAKNLMPVSAGSMLEAATMTDKELRKALNVIIGKNGTSTYSDGRVAREQSGSEVKVYTYQDDTDSHTVLTLNHKTKEYTIDQYVHGKRTSSLDPLGGYLTFYNFDGTIQQQWIDSDTLQVHYYEYEDHTIVETDENGVLHQVRVLDKKVTYLSTAEGNTLYSTTEFTKEGSVSVETTTYEGSLKQEILKDGKLVQSIDENGLVTDYTYKLNKKGELVSRTGTREDGLVTIVKAKDLQVKKERINFQRVLKAALKSMLDPGRSFSARTRNGSNFVFEAGLLTTLQTSKNATYHFMGGMLQSVSDATGKTVVRLKDGMYINV